MSQYLIIKIFELFNFDCCNFSSTTYLLLPLFEKTTWKLKQIVINAVNSIISLKCLCQPLKTQRQISDFLVFGVSLVEVTVQNFRLLLLVETDLKRFFSYCDKLRQWNKQTVVEHYRYIPHNDFLIIPKC